MESGRVARKGDCKDGEEEKPTVVGVREVTSVGAEMSRRTQISGVEIWAVDGTLTFESLHEPTRRLHECG